MPRDHDYFPVARFLLPEDWVVEGTICALVPIPDDPQYLATLIGVIDALRYSASFDRDPTKAGAATVARTWAAALNSRPIVTVDCEGALTVFDVRQKPDEPCILEKSTDGGETWTQWADLTLCPPPVALASDGKTLIYWCPTCGPGGGPGWSPVPNPDMTYNPGFDDPQAPITEGWVDPGNDPNCVYAANLMEAMRTIVDRIDVGLETGILATMVYQSLELAQAINNLLPKGRNAILETLANMAALDYATFHDDYDTFDWQALTDKLCCFFSDDGTVTPEDYEVGVAAMAGETSPVWQAIKAIIAVVGTNGLNNAADYAGIHAADCSCDCDADLSLCWDLRAEDFNFTPVAGHGTWTDGVGWRGQLDGGSYILDITNDTDIPVGVIDEMRVDWEVTGGSKIMRCYIDGVLVREVIGGVAGNRSTTFLVGEAVDSVRIYLQQNTLNSTLNAVQVCFYRT